MPSKLVPFYWVARRAVADYNDDTGEYKIRWFDWATIEPKGGSESVVAEQVETLTTYKFSFHMRDEYRVNLLTLKDHLLVDVSFPKMLSVYQVRDVPAVVSQTRLVCDCVRNDDGYDQPIPFHLFDELTV